MKNPTQNQKTQTHMQNTQTKTKTKTNPGTPKTHIRKTRRTTCNTQRCAAYLISRQAMQSWEMASIWAVQFCVRHPSSAFPLAPAHLRTMHVPRGHMALDTQGAVPNRPNNHENQPPCLDRS